MIKKNVTHIIRGIWDVRFEVGGPKAEREFGATSSHCKVLERERGFQNEVFSSFFLCVKVRKVNSREKRAECRGKGKFEKEKENENNFERFSACLVQSFTSF